MVKNCSALVLALLIVPRSRCRNLRRHCPASSGHSSSILRMASVAADSDRAATYTVAPRRASSSAVWYPIPRLRRCAALAGVPNAQRWRHRLGASDHGDLARQRRDVRVRVELGHRTRPKGPGQEGWCAYAGDARLAQVYHGHRGANGICDDMKLLKDLNVTAANAPETPSVAHVWCFLADSTIKFISAPQEKDRLQDRVSPAQLTTANVPE